MNKFRKFIQIVFIITSCFIILNCSDNKNKNNETSTYDGRFNESVISSPTDGYIDSIFINSSGDRIYFLHSKIQPYDFINGTTDYPESDLLPGHTIGADLDWNTDLYYIEWGGTTWSAPVNLGSSIDGSNINSLANECCIWLNEDETEIIFYRDNLGLPELGETGNYISTRSDISSPWSEPVPLTSVYGIDDQSENRYRHDIQKTESGDLYLWEFDDTFTNKSRLLFGQLEDSSWLAPVIISGTDSTDDETQPWVSFDELVLIFNRRGPDGNTTLMKMTRPDINSSWGNMIEVPITGFTDSSGLAVWGEPTLPNSENHLLFIRFDTSYPSWKADMMYAPGTLEKGFGPAIKMN